VKYLGQEREKILWNIRAMLFSHCKRFSVGICYCNNTHQKYYAAGVGAGDLQLSSDLYHMGSEKQ